MNKPKLIFDMDGVLIDTNKAICSIYVGEYYDNTQNFKFPDYKKVNEWNYKDECPLFKEGEVEKIFDSNTFWQFVNLMPDTEEVLNELHKDFTLVVCTIGSFNNIKNKIIYIKENLPMIDEIVPIAKKNNLIMDKQIVNMSDALLFIDDHQDNLNLSNCPNKVCFGDVKSWNKDWQGDRVKNMKELYKYIKEGYIGTTIL